MLFHFEFQPLNWPTPDVRIGKEEGEVERVGQWDRANTETYQHPKVVICLFYCFIHHRRFVDR